MDESRRLAPESLNDLPSITRQERVLFNPKSSSPHTLLSLSSKTVSDSPLYYASLAAILISSGLVAISLANPNLRLKFKNLAKWRRRDTKAGRRKQQNLDKTVAAAQQAASAARHLNKPSSASTKEASSSLTAPLPPNAKNSNSMTVQPSTHSPARSPSSSRGRSPSLNTNPDQSSPNNGSRSSSVSEADPRLELSSAHSQPNVLARMSQVANSVFSGQLFASSSSSLNANQANDAVASTSSYAATAAASPPSPPTDAFSTSSLSPNTSSTSTKKAKNRKGKGVATFNLSPSTASSMTGSNASSPAISPRREKFSNLQQFPEGGDDRSHTHDEVDNGRILTGVTPSIVVDPDSPIETSTNSRPKLCDAVVQTSPILKSIDDDAVLEEDDFDLESRTLLPSMNLELPAAHSDSLNGSHSDASSSSLSRDAREDRPIATPSTAPTTPALTHSQIHARSRKAARRAAEANAKAIAHLSPAVNGLRTARARQSTSDSTGESNGGGSSEGRDTSGTQADCSGSSGGAQSVPESPGVASTGLPKVDGERWNDDRRRRSSSAKKLYDSLPINPRSSIKHAPGQSLSSNGTGDYSHPSSSPSSPYFNQSLALAMASPEHQSRRVPAPSTSTSQPQTLAQFKHGHRSRSSLSDQYWKAAEVGLAIDVEAATAKAGLGRGTPKRAAQSSRRASSEALGRSAKTAATVDDYFSVRGTPTRPGYMTSPVPDSPNSPPHPPMRSHSFTNGISQMLGSSPHQSMQVRSRQLQAATAESASTTSSPVNANSSASTSPAAYAPYPTVSNGPSPAGSRAVSRQSSMNFGFTPIVSPHSQAYLLSPAGQYSVHPSTPSPTASVSMAQQQQLQMQQQQQQLQRLHTQQMYNQAQAQAQQLAALEAQAQQLGLRQQQLSQAERAMKHEEQLQQHRMILLSQVMNDGATPSSSASNSPGAIYATSPVEPNGPANGGLVYPISSISNGSNWTPVSPPHASSSSVATSAFSTLSAVPPSSAPSSIQAYGPQITIPTFPNYPNTPSGAQFVAGHPHNVMSNAPYISPTAYASSLSLPQSRPQPSRQNSNVSNSNNTSRTNRDSNQRRTSGGGNRNSTHAHSREERARSVSANTKMLSALAEAASERGKSAEWQQQVKAKAKAVEIEVERSTKELEIARWRLLVLEEEQHVMDAENQEALRALAHRAMRAEQRIKLLEANEGSSASGSAGSPATRPASSSGADGVNEITELMNSHSDRRGSGSKIHPLAWVDLESVSFSARPLSTSSTTSVSAASRSVTSRRRSGRRSNGGQQQSQQMQRSTSNPDAGGGGDYRRNNNNQRRRSAVHMSASETKDMGEAPFVESAEANDDDEEEVLIVLEAATSNHSPRTGTAGSSPLVLTLPELEDRVKSSGLTQAEDLQYTDEDEISNFDVDEFEARAYRRSSLNQLSEYVGSLPTFLTPYSDRISKSRASSISTNGSPAFSSSYSGGEESPTQRHAYSFVSSTDQTAAGCRSEDDDDEANDEDDDDDDDKTLDHSGSVRYDTSGTEASLPSFVLDTPLDHPDLVGATVENADFEKLSSGTPMLVDDGLSKSPILGVSSDSDTSTPRIDDSKGANGFSSSDTTANSPVALAHADEGQ